MTIQYASDLHLELRENADFVDSGAIEPAGDILLLAGDICRIDRWNNRLNHFFDWLSNHYKQVLIVPGNEEFDRREDMELLGNCWRMMLRENVGVYYNQVVCIEDVEVVMVGNCDYIAGYKHLEGRKAIAISYLRPGKEWLCDANISHWIYGNTHEANDWRWNRIPKRRGNHCSVRLLSNQLGYVHRNQHLMGYCINKNITI